MDKLRDKFIRFMQGRYGMDELGRFLSYVLLALIVISFFWRSSILNLVILLLLIYTYYRMFSRDISARYSENQKFSEVKQKIVSGKKGFSSGKKDPTVRIFACPTCGQKVRVPKGKGKISIHCPKCNTDFIKRS